MNTDHLNMNDLDGAWSRLDPEERQMVMMWRAVIAQSIRDMASVDHQTALEAATWLGTEDYLSVCDLALVESESLETAIRQAMKSEYPLHRKFQTTHLADRLMLWGGIVTAENSDAP